MHISYVILMGISALQLLRKKKKKKISQFFATFPKRKKKKKGKMINLVGATHRDVASYCYVNFFFTLLHSGNAFPLPPRSTPKIRFSRDLEKQHVACTCCVNKMIETRMQMRRESSSFTDYKSIRVCIFFSNSFQQLR